MSIALTFVQEQYLKLFGKSLEKDIEGDCSGLYKNVRTKKNIHNSKVENDPMQVGMGTNPKPN
jgi:hypothetical protein